MTASQGNVHLNDFVTSVNVVILLKMETVPSGTIQSPEKSNTSSTTENSGTEQVTVGAIQTEELSSKTGVSKNYSQAASSCPVAKEDDDIIFPQDDGLLRMLHFTSGKDGYEFMFSSMEKESRMRRLLKMLGCARKSADN